MYVNNVHLRTDGAPWITRAIAVPSERPSVLTVVAMSADICFTSAIQGQSSGRVGDVCSFNTDCLSGMYCAIGQCRCLSTYIAVDAYCYERISPSESGCFYDVQCSAVWPDAFCKNGQCHCPSHDMAAVKTRDGTLCIWSSSTEPSCPLPSLPPPDSAAALVVLPAPS
ncbi:EB module, partial [Teladorsagia circumcincta]